MLGEERPIFLVSGAYARLVRELERCVVARTNPFIRMVAQIRRDVFLIMLPCCTRCCTLSYESTGRGPFIILFVRQRFCVAPFVEHVVEVQPGSVLILLRKLEETVHRKLDDTALPCRFPL